MSIRKQDTEANTLDLKRSKRSWKQTFQYDKLAPERVCILQATCELKRNGRRSLSTKLRSYHLKPLPHFIALSYAWQKVGNPHRTLLCNDDSITISAHVYTALENLVLLDAPCSFGLWIDAICIDQANDLDKIRQVPHMGALYG